MRDILIISVVLACSLGAIFRPVIGLLTFVWLGLFNPHSMGWHLYRTIPLAAIAGVSTVVGYLFQLESKRIPFNREALLLFMLWVMFGISTVFAIYPDNAYTKFIYISKVFLIVFLATSLINNKERLHSLLYVIGLSLGFYGLKGGVFSIVRGGDSMVFGPEGSFLFANNSMGLALAINVPILHYLWKVEARRWLRPIVLAMMAFSYPAVVCTFSRGAWLALAVVTFMIVLKSKRRVSLILLGVFFAIILMILQPKQLFPERVANRYEKLIHYKEDGSAQSRFWNWEFSRRVGMAFPLHGGGFDFYTNETLEKYYPEFLARWPGKLWSSHSIWFTVFGEHGFPGLMLWIGLIGSCFLSMRKIRMEVNMHSGIIWAKPCVEMLQIAMMGYMVAGTFLDAAYFDIFYYLVATMIIVKEQIRCTPTGRVTRTGVEGLDLHVTASREILSK